MKTDALDILEAIADGHYDNEELTLAGKLVSQYLNFSHDAPPIGEFLDDKCEDVRVRKLVVQGIESGDRLLELRKAIGLP